MKKNFETNRAEFELLIKMAEVDSNVMRIAPDFTWLKTDANWPRPASDLGISQERWDEYRNLFEKLGLKNGLVRYSEIDRVYLFAESEGLLTGGHSKGYVYSPSELSPLYESLKGLDLKTVEGNRAHRKISDKWYLYVYWE